MFELEISTRATHAYDAFISYNSKDRNAAENNCGRTSRTRRDFIWKDIGSCPEGQPGSGEFLQSRLHGRVRS